MLRKDGQTLRKVFEDGDLMAKVQAAMGKLVEEPDGGDLGSRAGASRVVLEEPLSERQGSGRIEDHGLAIGMIAWGACGKKELPPLSAIVDAPYFRSGSSWTYKVEDSTWNAPATVTLTYMKDDVYKNTGVLAFATGSETILYDRDLNFVAVASNGRILREASPSLRSFDFPFYVGKQWRSVFTFQDNQKGLSWTPVEVFWHVKEYDEITVPAGTC